MKVKVTFEQLIEMTATIEVTEGLYDSWRRTADTPGTDATLVEWLRAHRDQDALEINLMRANQREGGTQDVIEFTITKATGLI
jgi:hypothetical protein